MTIFPYVWVDDTGATHQRAVDAGIVEIDVSPLMVHAEGEGATALDALIVAE